MRLLSPLLVGTLRFAQMVADESDSTVQQFNDLATCLQPVMV